MMEEIDMSKKLMLIAAAIFGFNVCAMAQARPETRPRRRAEDGAEVRHGGDKKPADMKGKKAKRCRARSPAEEEQEDGRRQAAETPAAPTK